MAERNYKEEYKKFQSSDKAKKKRAELNKYNRRRGTYGNGDGKDASHKGGKIVGFEDESTNRGRREKSRKRGSKRNVNEADISLLKEKLKLYLKNLGGAYSKLVPQIDGGDNIAAKEMERKRKFIRMMNQYYNDINIDVELAENTK